MTPFAKRLVGVFLLALVVRGAHTASIGHAPFSRVLVGDGVGYDRWAATIASGHWMGSETFYQAPLYPYALAVLYATAGRDPMTVRWAQAVLGALACVLLALAGAVWLSPREGLIAGTILAIYPPAIFFDSLIQKASLDNVLMCALLAVLGAYAASLSLRRLFAAGIILGLFALTRENALVFLFVLAAWIPFRLADRTKKDRAVAVAVLVAGVALVLLPVGLRNKVVGGDFLVTTSQGGPNFYIGNHEGATGRYVPILPNRETWEFERVDATEVAEKAAGRTLTPGEVSSYWWSRSSTWIGEHPGAWVALLGKKIFVVWNRAELPDSESLEVYADASPVLRALAMVFGFGVLLVLAAPGMALAWRRSPRPTLLYAMLFAFSAAVALFYVFARYRFPMVPILALFAAVTVDALRGFLRGQQPLSRRGKAVAVPSKVAVPLVAATIAGIALAAVPPVVPAIGSRRLAYVNLGVALAAKNDHAGAAEAYREAIAIAPRIAAPHHDLATELSALGRGDLAIVELQTALQLDPGYAAAHDELGALLIKRGDFEGARSHLQEAMRLDPSRSSAAANLGTAALAQRVAGDAVSWYRKAIVLAPDNASYHYQLSIALTDAGQIDEAERELQETIRLDPKSAAAHEDLGLLAAHRGDFATAQSRFMEANRIDPSRVSTLVNLGGVAMSQNRAQDAADWYRKALALRPDLPQVRANLEQALAHGGGRR